MTSDIATIRRYREELAVATYLSDLTPNLSSQIQGPILGADSTPNFESTFARVLRVFIGISTSTLDHSAMTATRGRDRSFGQG